jgi:hypothetical protein
MGRVSRTWLRPFQEAARRHSESKNELAIFRVRHRASGRERPRTDTTPETLALAIPSNRAPYSRRFPAPRLQFFAHCSPRGWPHRFNCTATPVVFQIERIHSETAP